ncbi:MAG: hypothetical protein Q3996_02800 [Candidatus Saccharibacteria bacterium]|nr:hypothetical protein [Candidatus Saccharibacteria bacterium]
MNFREIVAQLSYSPNMIWHLASYAKKIRIEKKQTHRIILFCLLNIVLLSYAVIINEMDQKTSLFPRGINNDSAVYGLSSVPIIKNKTEYNNFNKEFSLDNLFKNLELASIYSSFGISRESITNFKIDNSHTSSKPCFEISRHSFRSNSSLISNVKNTTLYASPCLNQYYGPIFYGKTKDKSFVILNNGNILLDNAVDFTIDTLNPNINVVNLTSHEKQPKLISPNQTISYQFSFTNTTNAVINRDIVIDTSSIQQYANLRNPKEELVWSLKNLQPGESSSRELVFDINRSSPKSPVNLASNEVCAISIRADDSIATNKFNCNTFKLINDSITLLTPAYFIENNNTVLMILTILLIITIILKLIRLLEIKILETSIRMIRHNINQGAI